MLNNSKDKETVPHEPYLVSVFFNLGSAEFRGSTKFLLGSLKMLLMVLQYPPLNGFTLAQHKRDNNNRMIQLTDIFCVLFKSNGTSDI